ncbi:hypothetical protein G9A89_011701 [Geosiphon pyriformis]|nr:hypothetical protein G9A89_011701 [Geosiphon pyriformis]
MSENTAHCSAIWSNIRKLGHIAQKIIAHHSRMEINQIIKRYTQQQFLITYADKGKEKLQTPAVTPKQIQPPNWKKTQVELPTNLSYYYMPESAINILSTDKFILNETSIFGCFPFQSKQQKAELLGPYDFRITSPWEITELEEKQKKEEKKSEDQKFTYQNPIPENPDIRTPNFQTQQNLNSENPEIETPNFQMQHNQNDQNLDINNQQHLPLVIVINPFSAPLIDEQQQQSLQPPQQPQQPLPQSQQ